MKPIHGYEGRYSASDDGRIFSHKSQRFLKARPLPKGYLRVQLVGSGGSIKDYLIHRLVCAAYHGLSDLDVNHKDCNKANNHPDNLEWCSKSENMQHANANGRLLPQRIATANRNQAQFAVPVVGTSVDGMVVKKYPSMTAASQDGFSHSKISLCVAGKRKTHRGFTWAVPCARWIGERIQAVESVRLTPHPTQESTP
jgi:hypothetical protein